ncbi:alcohol dehydrogenase [Aspergillus indologenus CBS 114.80]|uniref:Alcohol dehydrogenase n=1 Tax=Aspergillus indologenus CBS 114.80 TaxID=1450541 RepID=A0A2V5IJK8_9EURO|nr:alcohol dehydrogenase [Aspergillus indologenus CBS 114.80]
MPPIPKTQTAAWIENPRPHAHLELRHEVPVPEPGGGEVLVKLECTGFCHSDLHCIYGELPMSVNLVGHDGVGRVVKLGPNAPRDMLGMRVGVKWLWSSCKDCPTCKVQYTNYPNQRNSGRSVPGTFQQYVVSPADFVSPIPENLAPETVAPLLCAGLTTYGALNKLDKYCDKGDWVVIMDICMQSGAEAFVDFSDDPTTKIRSLTDGIGAHAVIVSVEFPRPVGTLVCVGLPRPDYHLPISPLMCVDRGYRIVGSAVGTEDEMQALLRMAAAGKVVTHVTVFELEDINEVAGLLGRFEVEGRAVLRIPA